MSVHASVPPSAAAAPSGARSRFRFDDLGLRTKLLGLLGASVVVTVLCVGVAFVALRAFDRTVQDLADRDALAAVTATEARMELAVHRRLVLQLILDEDPDDIRGTLDRIVEVEQQVDDDVAALQANKDGQEMVHIPRAVDAWAAQKRFFRDRIEQRAGRPDRSGAEESALSDLATGGFGTVADAAAKAFDALEDDKKADLRAGVLEVQRAGRQARTELLAAAIVGSLLLVVAGWWVAGLITRPVLRIKAAVDAFADGDLTARADVDSRDEIGRMAASLGRAQDVLRESITTIMSSSTTLVGSAEELSAVSARVAASAEETSVQSGTAAAAAEQVSLNVQTVATATEEMSASIREISQSSTDAVRVAQAAADEAQHATGTVAKLGDSSRRSATWSR